MKSNKTLSGEHVDEFGVPPELQTAWIRHLRWFFDFYNYQYLDCRMRPPLFRLGESGHRLGQWDAATRTINVSVAHILENAWESVLETLRHEMAHQYVDEVMQIAHAPPHGAAFAQACRLLRCDAACRAVDGDLKPMDSSGDERDRILTRIRELLALAGSPNEHEAATAMRMAHKYLLKYNLSLEEIEGERNYGVRFLGRSAARIQEYEYTLGHILQEHFFVLVLWTFSYNPERDKLGRILQISGGQANLEVADYVYHYVMGIADSLWKEHKRRPGYRGGTKLQYLAGLLRGLLDKLARQKWELKKEHGLVWRGDSALDSFFRHLNPRTSSSSGGGGVSRGDGYYRGIKDGWQINIRRPLGSASKNRGRALPKG